MKSNSARNIGCVVAMALGLGANPARGAAPGDPARRLKQAPAETVATVEARLNDLFVEGVRQKDRSSLEAVMKPETRHLGYENGEFGTWSGADWFAMVDGWKRQPGPMPLRAKALEVVSVGRDTAMVQVRLDFAFGTFTDLLSLEREGETWMIVNKAFSGGRPAPSFEMPDAEAACKVVRRFVDIESSGEVEALKDVCHPLVFARRVGTEDGDAGWTVRELDSWEADPLRKHAGVPKRVEVFEIRPSGALALVESRVVFEERTFVDRYALLATADGWRVVSRMTESEHTS